MGRSLGAPVKRLLPHAVPRRAAAAATLRCGCECAFYSPACVLCTSARAYNASPLGLAAGGLRTCKAQGRARELLPSHARLAHCATPRSDAAVQPTPPWVRGPGPDSHLWECQPRDLDLRRPQRTCGVVCKQADAWPCSGSHGCARACGARARTRDGIIATRCPPLSAVPPCCCLRIALA